MTCQSTSYGRLFHFMGLYFKFKCKNPCFIKLSGQNFSMITPHIFTFTAVQHLCNVLEREARVKVNSCIEQISQTGSHSDTYRCIYIGTSTVFITEKLNTGRKDLCVLVRTFVLACTVHTEDRMLKLPPKRFKTVTKKVLGAQTSCFLSRRYPMIFKT